MIRKAALVALLAALLAATTAAQRPGPELVELNRLIEGGNYEQALAGTEAWLRRRPADPQALFLKGLALTGLERWSDAVATFQKVLELEPGSSPALRNAGIASYHLGRSGEAVSRFRN